MLVRVVVEYRGTIVEVAHLGPGERFSIGESPAASFVAAIERELVEIAGLDGEGGEGDEGIWVSVAAPLRVRLGTPEGVVELDAAGPGRRLHLGEDEWARLELGDLSFHVRSATAEELRLTRRPADPGLRASLLSIGALALAFGALMHLSPASEHLALQDDTPAYARYVTPFAEPVPARMELPKPPPPPPPPPPVPDCGDKDDQIGVGGREEAKKAPGESGKRGAEALAAGRPGPEKHIRLGEGFDPELAARQAGILGVMQQNSGDFVASPYGAAFAVGNYDMEIWSGLDGTSLAGGYTRGNGGLGLIGTGRGGGGGGGSGQGTIGLGSTGLIGKGGGGTGCALCLARRSRMRMGRLHIEGSSKRDSIRRQTKMRFREILRCHETASRRVRKLAGRVELSYTISTTGKVTSVLVEKSPDETLGVCIAKTTRRWTFPRSQTATVVQQRYDITYR